MNGSTLTLGLVGALAAAGALSRRGSAVRQRPNLNPYRGRHTLGAPEELVSALTDGVLAEAARSVNQHGYVSWTFSEGMSIVGGLHAVSRPDGREVLFRLVLHADPSHPMTPVGGVGVASRSTGQIKSGDRIILMRVRSGKSMADYPFRSEVSSFLAHELTHLMDPGRAQGDTRRSKRRSTGADLWSPSTDAQWSEYVNDESEIKAYLHQVFLDLHSGKAAKMATSYMLSEGEPRDQICRTILKLSPSWVNIEDALTPKNRRRFLRVAADFVLEVQRDEDPKNPRHLA